MPSRSQRKKPIVSRLSIGMLSISINGSAGQVVNYTRVEREDGSIEETGRPAGMAAGLPLNEVLQQAWASTRPAKQTRRS